MVVVPGGWVSLTYPLPPHLVKIDDFLIDRNEVTNEEYKRFVDAGGYQKHDFWKQPFVRDGHAISWEEALPLFVMPQDVPVQRRGNSATIPKATRNIR